MVTPVAMKRAGETRRDPLGFLAGVAEKLGFYVYALIDPQQGEIFYVGKGRGERAFQHARYALKVDPSQTRTQLKLDVIREIHAAKREVRVEIVRHGLTETMAYEVEAAVIDALNLAGAGLTNIVSGHQHQRGWRPLEEVVLSYAAHPKAIADAEAVVLIRINKRYRHDMSPQDLYEATCKWWRVAPARRNPTWAFAVYNGIVRAVYRVESWEKSPTSVRWAFVGSVDPAMEAIYVWTDVSRYFRAGAQSPVTYVNC